MSDNDATQYNEGQYVGDEGSARRASRDAVANGETAALSSAQVKQRLATEGRPRPERSRTAASGQGHAAGQRRPADPARKPAQGQQRRSANPQRRPAKGQPRPASAPAKRPEASRPAPAAPVKRGGSIWTPANIVTCVRIAFIPVWLGLAEFAPASNGQGFSLPAFLVALLYIAICLTDKLDGYLARSRDQVTTFGKFLDPIADKLVVLVALCFLLEQNLVWSWVLLIVIAREFLVSGLRMVVASEGMVVAASKLGKWKTAVTMIAISVLLLGRCLPAGIPFNVTMTAGNILMLAAVVLTAWSGIEYFIQSWPYIAESE